MEFRYRIKYEPCAISSLNLGIISDDNVPEWHQKTVRFSPTIIVNVSVGSYHPSVDTQSEMWRGVVLLCAVIILAGAAASEYDNRNQIKSGINTPVDQRRRGDLRELDARWSHEESRVTRQNSHPIVYLLSTLLRLLSLLVRHQMEIVTHCWTGLLMIFLCHFPGRSRVWWLWKQ